MSTFSFPVLAALAATATSLPAGAPQPAEGVLALDSTVLAHALSGRELELVMRGTAVVVEASAIPAEGGCAALVTAQAPGKPRRWSRLFRWSEVAWSDSAPGGRAMVAFYEQEGRLPADTVSFAPADAPSFQASLARVVSACRAGSAQAQRVMIDARGASRGCYFAAVPALQLLDAAGPPTAAPRAVLTVLARETPQAELQLLLERAASDPVAGGDDWGQPAVAFTVADPRLKETRVAAASFALDGRPFAAEHALAAYGDTRIRISMDPFVKPANGKVAATFYHRLAGSGEATLTLLDAQQKSRAVLHFDAGPAMAGARMALQASNWSCEGAVPAPEPAATWRPAG